MGYKMLVDIRLTVGLSPLTGSFGGQDVVSVSGSAELLGAAGEVLKTPVSFDERVTVQRWRVPGPADPLFAGISGLNPGDVIQVRGNLEAAGRVDKKSEKPKAIGFFRISAEKVKMVSRGSAAVVAADAWQA